MKNDCGPTIVSGGRGHRPLDEAGAVPDPGPTIRNGGTPDVTHSRTAGRPFREEQPKDSLVERMLENTIKRVDMLELFILAQTKAPTQAVVQQPELTWGDVLKFVRRKLFGGGAL